MEGSALHAARISLHSHADVIDAGDGVMCVCSTGVFFCQQSQHQSQQSLVNYRGATQKMRYLTSNFSDFSIHTLAPSQPI